MSLPYIGYANDTLAQQPEARAGQRITCPQCAAKHALEPADDGSELLLWYSCGDGSYLAAVAGRLVMDIRPDVTGIVPCGARDDGTGTEDWSTGTEGEP